ncbi:hypothetical protein DEU56DRAFT_912050 [Suillus clintonianus]|uniref:uncharacterized protein n=1 Tax=Suillus clintonianus TaxID=1904413 RepID=UPI001B866F4B|nr:uncharacterized protein DEU56DRAFT_912050 [Suillus clintonianus]KAG2139784.1 hypothetical protein DEU56DRAFT_912050 [Suillus clintonianus]
MPSESPTSAWLKTNGTKPKSRVKAQGPSPQAPSLSGSTDIIAQSAPANDFEVEVQAIQIVLEGLKSVFMPSDHSNEVILDALQQVQLEPICFYNVPYHEFAMVLDAISNKGDFLYCLANEITSALSSAICSIQYKRSLLMINIIPGRISSNEIFTIPDLQITLTPTTKKPSATLENVLRIWSAKFLDFLEKPESTFFLPVLTERKSCLRLSHGENSSGRQAEMGQSPPIDKKIIGIDWIDNGILSYGLIPPMNNAMIK